MEEQDFTENDKEESQKSSSDRDIVQPAVNIRDTSRSRLQRLGALYSNTDDLSSPIHRTEGKFHAECDDDFDFQIRKPNQQRLGKLAMLANTINQWEDDTSHHILGTTALVAKPPPKPDLPSREKLLKEKQLSLSESELSSNYKDEIKQLKWDPKVLNSLEAQGFQRRESSTVKVCYEFGDIKENIEDSNVDETACSLKSNVCDREGKSFVGKSNTNKFVSNRSNSAAEKHNNTQTEKKVPTVKPGLVSGRAAIFESQAQSINQQQKQQKPQKDPTELSLKERMKLFEKNKGEALIPKAAFGMPLPKSKISHDSSVKKEEFNGIVLCRTPFLNLIFLNTLFIF